NGVVDLLAAALLNPEQAGDAPVLLAAGAAAGKLEAEQFGQALLRLLPLEALAAHPQQAALAPEEPLLQMAFAAVQAEHQLDAGGGAALPLRAQVVDATG